VEHLTLKAATTATDQGTFTAVISAASIDREHDVVSPHGMARALRKWTQVGKRVPLAWHHSTAADQQIGYIDPESVQVADGEVVASGWIDQSTDTGKHAWRLVKTGTLGFSFGYLTLEATPRGDGGKNLNEFDVLEVTATQLPMNNDTRVLGWKAADGGGQERILQSMIGQAQEYIDGEDDPDDQQAMQDVLELLQAFLADEADEDDEGDEADDTGKAVFGAGELRGAVGGDLKAVWTTAYVNTLPDSAFLYVEGGGTKDSDGKTVPRSLRHFPYKNDSGAVDLPHLRNALARIPQSNLPQDVKDRLTAKAQRLLDSAKSADVTARPVDPLRKQADAVALEHASGGASLRKPKPPAPPPQPPDLVPLKELKRQMRDVALTSITGD
jgi:HK97 family phage prohead protease